MITFFESFRLRHSQFYRATRESFLLTYQTGNDPQYKSAHYSNLKTSLNRTTKCLSKLTNPLPAPIKNNKYDLNTLEKSVDKDIPERFHDQIGSLVKEFSDIFSKSKWDLGKCDVTTHRTEVQPGSKLSRFPLVGCRCITKRICRRKLMFFWKKN